MTCLHLYLHIDWFNWNVMGHVFCGYCCNQKWEIKSETLELPVLKCLANRLVGIIANDFAPMLTKPCPQRPSSFSNIKNATSTAWDAVGEMGGGAPEIVFDMVLRFWGRNDGSRVYNITCFAFTNPARKRVIMWRRILWQGAMNQGFTDIFAVSKRN